jgi:putative transferase (TIGR04331 family)
MPNIPRYLISTSDERTWKFDRPVVFLGEWCRTYNRKHIWQNMDAIVAMPYGLSLAQKDADNNEARALEENLLSKLREALNEHHGVQHGERFWRIVLGHWLRRYVDVMLNRVKTLELCLQSYEISGTTAYSNAHYTLATTDSYSAIWAFNDNRWNNALGVRILDLMGATSCPVEVIEDCTLPGYHFNGIAEPIALKRTVLKWSHLLVGKLLSWLARDNDAFIINSYLPKKEEIKLQLALKQCPQLWASPRLEVSEKPDRTLRENLANKIVSNSSCNNLQDILSVMLFELLPICYLEGFKNLDKLVKHLAWPNTPKFILTCNNFDTDEVFKVWAANKVESGSKYFTGQHGNNYGTHRYWKALIEEITSDKFLTWGWTDGLSQHTPAFLFKTLGRNAEHYNPQGELLLIEVCLNRRVTTWDGTFEFSHYFQDQQHFIQLLESQPKQRLIIRLHRAYQYLSWFEEERWQAIDPALKINTGSGAITELISQSRLVVHSYDSTGILETLSQNIPTLAFWQNDFDHLRESAKPYYQLLVDAGIVHLTSESVAQKVNEVWDDVNAWWLRDNVQDARLRFCERYARRGGNVISDGVISDSLAPLFAVDDTANKGASA